MEIATETRAGVPAQDEIDAKLAAWRSRTTTRLLVLLAVAAWPLTFLCLMGWLFAAPGPIRIVTLLITLSITVAALLPRRYARSRLAVLFAATYTMAAVMLATNGMMGGGRVCLLTLPVFAAILCGVRQGWAAVVASMTLFALYIVWATGAGDPWRPAALAGFAPGELLWGQWLLLLASQVFVMVLFAQLQALQRRAMEAESRALQELERESVARRELEREVMRIGEEERRLLGADLHDGLCQQLTASLLHCMALENRLAAQHAPEALATVELRSMIEGSIDAAYDAVRGLCPVDLNPDALVSALQRLAGQTRDAHGIACSVRHGDGTPPCDPGTALQFYRIAQEAVANAVKHSHCSQLSLDLARQGDEIVLRIADDGVPPAAADRPKAGGLGMRIMAYRAEAAGGRLTVDHPLQGGCVVTCYAPARAGAEAAP